MTPDEKSRMHDVIANFSAAVGFVCLIQIPLTVFYIYRLRTPLLMETNQHLRKYLFALPLISIPWGLWTNRQARNFTQNMHDKYMSDLSDEELEGFD